MPISIKPGSQVICVEGSEQGEKGIVTRIWRHYDPGSGQTRKLVCFENGAGKSVTTRLNFVREL